MASLQFCTLRWFKAFLCEFNILFFEKINVALVNTVLGQASVIGYNMLFSKKLAVIHW